MSLLQVEGLGIDFGGLRAVNDVSFSLKAGEIVSVIGPNGAGKTTLFNMISGVYLPGRGRILLAGEDATGLGPHLLAERGLSRTFQNLQIFQTMTVLENVTVGHHLHERGSILADLLGLPGSRLRSQASEAGARELLKRVGLAQAAERTAGSLSYGALKRLDDGYERHKRFILDAAHELRTPVAILQTRVETLLDGPDRSRILADASRIAVLAEQLLDLQRLGGQKAPLIPLDLVGLCRSVVADMAPLAISQGYELSFEPDEEPILALADDASLQRALMNVVQNAIEHGGNRGTITIKVGANRVIDISDQGNGIPEEDREAVFDAFHRLIPKDRGTGLGLNLVQEIVRYHGGEITISDSPSGGASFRISLPYC